MKVVKLLLLKGAKRGIKDNKGLTAKMIVQSEGAHYLTER